MAYRVGIDIGGTFTDLFAYNTDTNQSICLSSSSTPENYANGVLNVIKKSKIPYDEIEIIIHGTTVATNAVIMGNYADTAFVTTEGMRDLVEIGRFHRKVLYDPYQVKPDPIVKRRNRFTIEERIDKDGNVLEQLNEDSVIQIAEIIKKKGIKAIAIGLINSYANPSHEQRTKEIIESIIPEAYVVNSESILPSIGALGRFTTAIINASLYGLVGKYIESLETRLMENGFKGKLLMVQSNGGAITAKKVKEKPETLLMSGPAGGVIGALIIGEKSGYKDIITFDMGGTSTDISIIEERKPFMTTDFEIEWDMPVPIPIIEVLSIGAGGGSVGWIDSGGSLRVGPKSAGANPGPACYGLGGTEPTVTDANLVLGYLDAGEFLQGDMKLDVQAARKAITDLGANIGLDMLKTAEGIIEIVNENMANAVKEITIGKGRDPRDFALSAFGGAGSLHAVAVSDKVGVPIVMVPPEPGNLCAFGDINMNLQCEVNGFFYSKYDSIDIDELNSKLSEMDKQGENEIKEQMIGCKCIDVKHMVSMRYVGQSYELEVPLPMGDVDHEVLKNLLENFHSTHEKIYFVCDRESDVEITKLRSTSVGVITDAINIENERVVESGEKTSEVRAYFKGQYYTTKVFERKSLKPGEKIKGPAIIREKKATTIIPPGKTGVIEKTYNNLTIKNL